MSDEQNEHKCPSGHSCSECGGKCGEEAQKLHQNLLGVRHIILVMSGKGGVGKSTVASNLALALASQGLKTGLLDVDFHGPSIPKMFGLENAALEGDENNRLYPVMAGNLAVMSIGFILQEEDQAVIWRGAMKHGVIQQLLSDVAWGVLDYLVIDAPPGTGDEPLSVCQLLPNADGAVVVTTPQDVAASDVAKSLNFCAQLDFNVIGILENMSGFVCPHCGEVTQIFAGGAGERLAQRYGARFLGRIPIDPRVCAGGDQGVPFVRSAPESPAAKAFLEAVAAIRAAAEEPIPASK